MPCFGRLKHQFLDLGQVSLGFGDVLADVAQLFNAELESCVNKCVLLERNIFNR